MDRINEFFIENQDFVPAYISAVQAM